MKSNFTKLLFLIFIVVITMIGCAPKGNPNEALNEYYKNIKDSNAEGAYATLSEESKKNFSKEDFVKWLNVKKNLSTLKETKIEKANEYKDKELDGVKFKNVVEFNVTEKIQSFSEDKEVTVNSKKHIVNDNGKWKVYRGKEDGKNLVVGALNDLAWMYIDGKGKTKNLNEAATILNDTVKCYPNYNETYYSLAVAYVKLNRYDDTISCVNSYLTKENEDRKKSNAYNVLGLANQGKNQYDKAREYFNEAIKLDSNNQYARTNLENINNLSAILK